MYRNKSLGQHFLIDPNILNKIVHIIPLKDENILEIGGGAGNLSKYIQKQQPKSFKIMEKDIFWVNELQNQGFNVIHTDCLKESMDYPIIISNLPYNLSVDILLHILKYSYKYFIGMFQKEVGEKILNPGFLNTIINLHASIKKVCDVNPKCFSPAPKVWSTIFLFEYKKQSNNYIQNKITQLYRNPNKKLKHNMLFIQDIYKEKRIKQLSFNQVRDIILYE